LARPRLATRARLACRIRAADDSVPQPGPHPCAIGQRTGGPDDAGAGAAVGPAADVAAGARAGVPDGRGDDGGADAHQRGADGRPDGRKGPVRFVAAIRTRRLRAVHGRRHRGHPGRALGDGRLRMAESETTRLEAFSDGVFAIAITLLILEIKVPAGPETQEHGLWRALLERWPSYVGYVISFATIGIMWVNHHALFKYISRVDRALLLATLLLLMTVSSLPYPTAVLAEHLPDADSR